MSSITPAITEFRAEAALVDGVIQPARILVEDGRITDLHVGDGPAEWLDELGAHVVEIPAGQVLLPAVVDTHVHMNEPGRTEWEGIRTATRAAAAGGVATVIDMPLNSIPSTVDVPALELKQALAREKSSVDVGFWGGAVPQSLGHLAELHEAGVFGFKCFLAPSGVDEFEHLNPEQLLVALAEIAEIDSLLIVHAEDGALLDELAPPLNADYAQFLASRPPVVEDTAIAHLIDGVRATGARVHILHLSSASALPLLRAAKAEGLPITVETCPHYLTLNAENIPEGATEFKCCPPIRDAANADLLWEALLDGTIDCIVSDHSPSPASMKYGHGADFGLAWGGISSLQLGLSVVWTEAFKRGVPLEKVVHWMSEATAGLVGLEDRGYISQGRQADFAVFAPTMPYEVDAEKLQHKHPITPYNHKTFHGRVVSTWLRGQQIFSLDEGVIQTPIQLL